LTTFYRSLYSNPALRNAKGETFSEKKTVLSLGETDVRKCQTQEPATNSWIRFQNTGEAKKEKDEYNPE
jgi:hypothetical protein